MGSFAKGAVLSARAAAVNATAVRPGFALDTPRLVPWLEENVPGFAGPLTIEQFSGTRSSPTFLLTTPGKLYVLRCKPDRSLLCRAHAIEREVRVMRVLSEAGFPVPHVYALCTQANVVGSYFYIMDYAEGRIFSDGGLPNVSRDQRRAYQEAMAETLGRLHSYEPAALGLADYDSPDLTIEHQLARWTWQYVEDDSAPRVADIDFLADWLPDHLPVEQSVRVVHGDYRIDNIVFHPDQPRVVAVLNWECSTLGEPMADLARNLMMYRLPAVHPGGLADRNIESLGIPNEIDYLAAYRRCADLRKQSDLDFYLVYNFFRMATIFHGIKCQLIRGNVASSRSDFLIAPLEELARRGRELAERLQTGQTDLK